MPTKKPLSRKTLSSALLALILILQIDISYAQSSVNPEIKMFLETPQQDATYTGVAFIRGWAVAPMGINGVQLFVDGSYLMDIPLGESRPGVQELYPSYPGSDTSGFNIAYQYSKLSAGKHQMTVRAIDGGNQYIDVSASFMVTRFNTGNQNNFIRNPSSVSLSGATVSNDGESIRISELSVDNRTYDVTIAWSTILQGLAITDIAPTVGGDDSSTADRIFFSKDGVEITVEIVGQDYFFTDHCAYNWEIKNTTNTIKDVVVFLDAFDVFGEKLGATPFGAYLRAGKTNSEYSPLGISYRDEKYLDCNNIGRWGFSSVHINNVEF
ncbi:Ig-like domain-containing protein [Lamprobacter modestohalophilus]|uniref:Ig-like domain-containing protein n=1 Tax=Lamprobacter modestohalophilus TaxID=1064514 RepID=UPI002ADEEA98|nr:Ig-like domain-containing protein [Lamprobacter modestohalophilus]MEA1051748.1 Ig-like domain-containing protein [Lamprobacter modestohalophilus]